jgi:hypothetical protein
MFHLKLFWMLTMSVFFYESKNLSQMSKKTCRPNIVMKNVDFFYFISCSVYNIWSSEPGLNSDPDLAKRSLKYNVSYQNGLPWLQSSLFRSFCLAPPCKVQLKLIPTFRTVTTWNTALEVEIQKLGTEVHAVPLTFLDRRLIKTIYLRYRTVPNWRNKQVKSIFDLTKGQQKVVQRKIYQEFLEPIFVVCLT